MKFKVKEIVSCEVEIRKSGVKAVVYGPIDKTVKTETQQFQVIAARQAYPGSEDNVYTILIPDDFLGWNINAFHIQHYKINPSFNGKRFWDVTEEYMKKDKK